VDWWIVGPTPEKVESLSSKVSAAYSLDQLSLPRVYLEGCLPGARGPAVRLQQPFSRSVGKVYMRGMWLFLVVKEKRIFIRGERQLFYPESDDPCRKPNHDRKVIRGYAMPALSNVSPMHSPGTVMCVTNRPISDFWSLNNTGSTDNQSRPLNR
jgi:hypothetical protein